MDTGSIRAGLVNEIVIRHELHLQEAEALVQRASNLDVFHLLEEKIKEKNKLIEELLKNVADLTARVAMHEKVPFELPTSPLPHPPPSPTVITSPVPPPPPLPISQQNTKFRQDRIEAGKEKDGKRKLPFIENVGQVFGKPVSGKSKDLKNPTKPNCHSMLSKKRQNDVMAFRMKHKTRGIDEAILNILTTFELEQENEDIIEQVEKHKPTASELAEIRGAPLPRHEADEYMLFLSEIPKFEDRVRCYLLFARIMAAPLNLTQVKHCRSVLDELRSNSHLTKILQLILQHGNYLNGHSKARERADGFDLEVLARLNRVIGHNGESFLTYIVNVYQNFYYSSDDLPTMNPVHFQGVKGIDLNQIEESIVQMRANVKECETRASKIVDEMDGSMEHFQSVINKALDNSNLSLQIVGEQFENLKNMYTSMVKFYHVNAYVQVDGKQVLLPVVDFFKPMEAFHLAFKEIWSKECKKKPYTTFDKFSLRPIAIDATKEAPSTS